MAAVVATNMTFNTTAGNKTIGPTPNIGELMVVVVAASGMTSGLTVSDNQAGGTYTQIGTFALNNTSADCIGVFVRNNLISVSAVHTVTAGESTSTGGGLCGIRVSGMARAGSLAVRSVAGTAQFAKQENQAAATPAPVLPANADPTSVMIGAVLDITNGTANSAPPTGWTEQQDNGYNNPTTGIAIETRDSGETNKTITFGAAAPSQFAAIVIELDTSTQIPGPVPHLPFVPRGRSM